MKCEMEIHKIRTSKEHPIDLRLTTSAVRFYLSNDALFSVDIVHGTKQTRVSVVCKWKSGKDVSIPEI